MVRITRVHLAPAKPAADGNIRVQYPIDHAAWVWHPECDSDEATALRFTNRFTLDQPRTVRIHLSADQRYELSLDGAFVGMGPDRCDALHWSFASYDVELPAGEHEFLVTAWHFGPRDPDPDGPATAPPSWPLGQLRPHAQVTLRPGFIFAAEGMEQELNTGEGPWRVSRVLEWSFQESEVEGYHVVGPQQTIDGRIAQGPPDPAVKPAVVRPAFASGDNGAVVPLWRMHPSNLPDMLRQPVRPGRIRAVDDQPADAPVTAEAAQSPAVTDWQNLVGGASVQVPAHTFVRVIWDLDNYYCGYERMTFTGGRDAEVTIEWAESLYQTDGDGRPTEDKGNRDEIAGKVFAGFGDRFIPGGGESESYQPHWWRSGRYVQITVQTRDEPLRIDGVEILETHYPFANGAEWRSDDAELDAAAPLMVRGMEMSCHETFTDCPYYEQMMYVGDTRLEMLVCHAVWGDDRLVRRGIELFDWSRWHNGIVLERYPSMPLQLSTTYAMLWPLMVRDYAWWRDDPAWVSERLLGVRSLVEHLLALRDESGLVADLPGWSFMDWVPGWEKGYAPDGRTVSALNNLQMVLCLQAAAELEAMHGEDVLAQRCQRLADELGEVIVARFFDEERGCLADDLAHEHFSEHAQALALLAEILSPPQRAKALELLLDLPIDFAGATIYFSFYPFEALYRAGRADAIHPRLGLWKNLPRQGLRTPVEQPEPTRSDCHAWGSHPLFHYHASFAGIRPAEPGFQRVRIAPSPGPLEQIETAMPHPRGRIEADLKFENGACRAAVTLPAGVPGVLVWNGREHELAPGERTELTAE
ncbi:MAG: alpha-L-rhamnosidase C-terminal domain-containing protein [Phycisphaeraceae bacterium]